MLLLHPNHNVDTNLSHILLHFSLLLQLNSSRPGSYKDLHYLSAPALIYQPICRIVNGAPVNGGNIVRANLMIRFEINQIRLSGVGEPVG